MYPAQICANNQSSDKSKNVLLSSVHLLYEAGYWVSNKRNIKSDIHYETRLKRTNNSCVRRYSAYFCEPTQLNAAITVNCRSRLYLIFTPRPVGPEGCRPIVVSCVRRLRRRRLLATTPTWCNILNSCKHTTPPAIFLTEGQGQTKKNLVNAITLKIVIGSIYFLCEVTNRYNYRDDLIRFSADNQKRLHLATKLVFCFY